MTFQGGSRACAQRGIFPISVSARSKASSALTRGFAIPEYTGSELVGGQGAEFKQLRRGSQQDGEPRFSV